MDEDLDMLGAEGLGGSYIVLRVRSLDKQKLGQALGGKAATALSLLPQVALDKAPQVVVRGVLDTVLPIAMDKVRDGYGVDLEYQLAETPPPKSQPTSGGGAAGKVLLGAALGVAGAVAASHFGLVGAGRNLLHKVGL